MLLKCVTSYGILAFVKNVKIIYDDYIKNLQPLIYSPPQEFKLLLIQRKHTIAYNDIIRGKYKYLSEIPRYIQQLTPQEVVKLKNYTFDELWNDLWVTKNKFYNDDKEQAFIKFNQLNLKKYIENYIPKYYYTEFGIPKGRKHKKENSLECAIREFEEETNLKKHNYVLLENIEPIEEIFHVNNIIYKHIYYFAVVNSNIVQSFNLSFTLSQKEEIKYLNFFSLPNCLLLLRDYHIQKKKIIEKSFDIIKNI